jgi:hypothetical protein
LGKAGWVLAGVGFFKVQFQNPAYSFELGVLTEVFLD